MVAIDGLNPNDPGIGLLARAVAGVPDHDVLLAYCGDVPGIGPRAHRLILDARERVGARHACSDARLEPDDEPLTESFTAALTWPRAHLGKDFSLRTLAEAALRLRDGGVLHCAVRKQKGAKSLATAIGDMMGHVAVTERASGYQCLTATRTDAFDEALARTHWSTSYEIVDARFGRLGLRAVPGVFSRQALDAGTAQLIDFVAEHERSDDVSAVVDLCAGIGPLAIWAARRWASAQIVAVETNLLAVACIDDNTERHGVNDRVHVEVADASARGESTPARLADVVLCNPPTHADPEALAAMLGAARSRVAADGRMYVVVNRPGRTVTALREAGATVETSAVAGYTIVTAR